MSNQNVPAQQQDGIGVMLAKQAPAIARAISGATPEERQARAERFTRVALTTLKKNWTLMKCTTESVMGALMHCASFDMEPDARGLVWLVPYKNKRGEYEAQFQLGYKGMVELASRSGQVVSIYADVVYEPEYEAGMFHYIGGTERRITHERDLLKPELRTGKVVAAYAVAEMKNGAKVCEVVDRAYLDKRRNASQAGGSEYSPWSKWYEEMAKKTAIKALCRTLPQSVENLHRAIAIENEYEAKVIDDERGRAQRIDGINRDLLGIDGESPESGFSGRDGAAHGEEQEAAPAAPLGDPGGTWEGLSLDPDGFAILHDEENEFIVWAKQRTKDKLVTLAGSLGAAVDPTLDKPKYMAALAATIYRR